MKIAQTVILLICLAGVASGQCKDGKPSSASGFRSLIKFEGWEIPALKESKVFTIRQSWKANREGTSIYLTILKPEERIVVEVLSPAVDDCQNLYLSQNQVSVGWIRRFDVDGKVFCYVVDVNMVGVGASYYLLYYDEDGDGKFEKLERGAPEPRLPGRLKKRS